MSPKIARSKVDGVAFNPDLCPTFAKAHTTPSTLARVDVAVLVFGKKAMESCLQEGQDPNEFQLPGFFVTGLAGVTRANANVTHRGRGRRDCRGRGRGRRRGSGCSCGGGWCRGGGVCHMVAFVVVIVVGIVVVVVVAGGAEGDAAMGGAEDVSVAVAVVVVAVVVEAVVVVVVAVAVFVAAKRSWRPRGSRARTRACGPWPPRRGGCL